MKKLLTVMVIAAVLLGLGAAALAAGSPSPDPDNPNYTTRLPQGAGLTASEDLALYDADDKLIATVPAADVIKLAVGDADKLDDEDKEAFLSVYESVKEIKDQLVKYFCWIDIPEEYKTDDLAYARFEFLCDGENVQVTVNGKSMEVVNIEDNLYYAKLTEFGAVAILCDLPA